MKKQLLLTFTFCALLCTIFGFITVPQQPKIIISGNTIVEEGDEENLFMVSKTTDFKVLHMEGGGAATIKFKYQEEELETSLKPGNEIRLLASEGFVSAEVSVGEGNAVLRWELYER